jgi:uncharacterized protein YkwD
MVACDDAIAPKNGGGPNTSPDLEGAAAPWLQCSSQIRWLGRVLVARVLMGATVSIATPLAGAHSNGNHRHHSRHHRRRHHRRHHVRRHHGRRQPSAHSAQDTYSFCPYADAPATSASLAQMDSAVDCLVNQQRVRLGLPALSVSSQLNTSAQNWNDHMVGTGNFTHGSDQAFSDRLLAVGYNWGEGGENIATGYMTPRDAVAAGMASQEHCQNLLTPDYANMGTGETPAPVGNFAGTPATWTQDFGLLMNASAPSHDYGPMNGCPYTIASSPSPSSSSSGSSQGAAPTGTPTTPTTPTGPTGPTAPTGPPDPPAISPRR